MYEQLYSFCNTLAFSSTNCVDIFEYLIFHVRVRKSKM